MKEKSDKQPSSSGDTGNKYRVVILDDDTLAELKTFRLSVSRVAIVCMLVLILIIILTYLTISYTPVRYTVPGYGDIKNNKVYMELYERLNELEEELDAQRVYTEGLKNLLNPSGQGSFTMTESDEMQPDKELSHFYFRPPVKGEISASFDIESKHLGTDIIAPKNTPVKSILDGMVIYSDWSVRTGNTISIQHDNNIVSVYKHNSALLKSTGERVLAGEAIAVIGNTGEQTTGPHVHFEMWHKGAAINPEDYIIFE